MRGTTFGIAAAFVIGGIVGWVVANSAAERSRDAGISEGSHLLSTQYSRIETQLGAVVDRLDRIATAPQPASEVVRSEIPPEDQRAELSKELIRLRVEIDRLMSTSAALDAAPLTVENLVGVRNTPANWVELEKLSSKDVRDALLATSEDDLIRCFGRPTARSLAANGLALSYIRQAPQTSVIFMLCEGRVASAWISSQ